MTRIMKLYRQGVRRRIRVIQLTVAEYFELPVELMTARDRTADVAKMRQMAMALSRTHTKYNLAAIGASFDRDHGTIIHAFKAVKHGCETDEVYRAEYAECERRVIAALMPKETAA